MKNIPPLLSLILMMVIFRPAAAQLSSTYIFFQPIYAIPTNSVKLSENVTTYQGITYTKGVYGSYGSGLCLQAGFGKMINSNFGVEVAVEWVNGQKISQTFTSDDFQASGEASASIDAGLIKPVLVFKSSGDLLQVYSKLGLVISAYAHGRTDVSLLVNSAPTSLTISSESSSFSPKVGFTAAFGLSFRVSQSIALKFELNGQMIALPVKEGHYTQYQVNGSDMLPGFTTNQKSWTYQETISTKPQDPNQPSQRIYEPANFSYIGIATGINYYF